MFPPRVETEKDRRGGSQTQKAGYNAHDPGSCPNFTFAIVTTTRWCHHLNVTIPTKDIYLLALVFFQARLKFVCSLCCGGDGGGGPYDGDFGVSNGDFDIDCDDTVGADTD